MRGDKCPYDHGPDPVVVEETSLEKMVKGVKTTNYPVYNPLNPPPPGVDFVASTSSEGMCRCASVIKQAYPATF